MKIVLRGISQEHSLMAKKAVKMVDTLVWGNKMNKMVKYIEILRNGEGNPEHPPIFKGLYDVYNLKTKKCILHIGGLIGMGENSESNMAWSICHDLAHAFDVAHGNLSFNLKNNTLNYLGRDYDLKKPVNTYLPPEYSNLRNYRETIYYAAHDYYEPWETRALMAADACMAEFKRGDFCPNLLKKDVA